MLGARASSHTRPSARSSDLTVHAGRHSLGKSPLATALTNKITYILLKLGKLVLGLVPNHFYETLLLELLNDALREGCKLELLVLELLRVGCKLERIPTVCHCASGVVSYIGMGGVIANRRKYF